MTKILVIDDVNDLREEIETLLDFEGYEVLGAEGGYQGISLAKANTPDLIICDIEMPDLNGYEVFRELHSEEETEFIPFIFLTGKTGREDFRLGMNLGADDYLTKPFAQDDLLNAIQTRLQRSNASQAKSQLEKERLVGRISQELSNPISSMKSASSLIQQLMGHSLPPHMSMILNSYQAGVERLERCNEQLMLQVRLESKTIDAALIEENAKLINSRELLETAIAMAHDFANSRKHIELRVSMLSGTSSFFGIGELLGHAVAEIIANALDFSPEERAVVIKQWVKDGAVSILVIDEGHGIPLNEIDEVVKPFHRANQQNRGGLGLGLSLANQIIALHGGRIRINSLELGTSVLIQLPAAE